MAEKQINGRIVHKHDTEANWNKATNFIPKKGEIIIYDPDSSYTYARVKVGDGTTKVTSLPFIDSEIKAAQTNISDTVASVKNNSITDLSVSGQTITYTKGDGSAGTITTQDLITRQTLYSSDYNLPLLMSYESNNNTIIHTDHEVFRNNSIYANPSTGMIAATSSKIGEHVTLQYDPASDCLNFVFI